MGIATMTARTMQTTRAQPKRKRAEVSYYEGSSTEAEADESDASDAASSPKKKSKTNEKAVSTRTLPKKKIFPFMELPAELKNKIYDVTLTDPNGIFFVSRTKQYRRTVERETPSSIITARRNRHYRNRWYNQQTSQSPGCPQVSVQPAPLEPAPLVPNMLLLNKEIYAQTQPILYATNAFAVEDTMALHAFLANIGTKNRATLADLTIKGWGYTKSHKALNHPAFTMLAGAVNLTRLHLDCKISWSGPKHSARQLYRDGFHWLEAMGAAKGQYDAAIDIVEIADDNLGLYYGRIENKPTKEERLVEFESELRKLLAQH